MPILKPALDIFQLASKVGVSEMAVKSSVSAVKSALSIFEILLPDPLASKDIPVRAPVAEMSQSEVLIVPRSPLSPNKKEPAVVKFLAISNDPANDDEPVPPTVNLPETET